MVQVNGLFVATVLAVAVYASPVPQQESQDIVDFTARDVMEATSNLPREIAEDFNFERDWDELITREVGQDLEAREPSFKSFIKKIGGFAKKAFHAVFRRDLEPELDAREFEDSEYEARSFEDAEIAVREFEDVKELLERYADESVLSARDLPFDMIDELD